VDPVNGSTSNDQFILAYDHGTTGIKAAIANTRGEILDFIIEETPVYLKDDGGAEQDPDEWWEAIVSSTKRLLDKKIVPVDKIRAICCSSQWSGTVAVDEEGNHLFNAVIWMDSRGAKWVHKEFKGFIKISGYPLRDIIRYISKAGGAPTMAGKDPIAHILFLKNEHPDLYKKTYKFLECKDYLNLKFTGKFAASIDSITLYWVTNTRNINNVHYDESLIKRMKINREKLPDLMNATDILGKVTKKVADELGINPGVKVVMGSPDLQSAVIGSGAVSDYEGHVYVGTSSWVICHVPYKKTDVFHNIASLPSSIPGRYFIANEQESAGACLTYLRDKILFIDDEKYRGNPEAYQLFDEMASSAPPGSNGVIFTPWLYGERSPVEDHTVRGGFHNLSLIADRNDIVRAVFEGVAFNSRWILHYVEKFIKRKFLSLNIIGGGARSDIWCQIYADILNKKIRRVADPIQANSRGLSKLTHVVPH